jgi:hypothetical protein
MRLNRTLRAGFALLAALMLPLQGYTAMPDCGHSIEASPTALAHCSGGPTATHRHGCGTCCCAAGMALTAVDWIAPHLIAPEVSLALLWSPPAVILDRLERPPRFIPAR